MNPMIAISAVRTGRDKRKEIKREKLLVKNTRKSNDMTGCTCRHVGNPGYVSGSDALFCERKPGFTPASVRTSTMSLYSHILQLAGDTFYNMVRVRGLFVSMLWLAEFHLYSAWSNILNEASGSPLYLSLTDKPTLKVFPHWCLS